MALTPAPPALSAANNDRFLRVIGAPIDLGVRKLGVDMGPTAIRYAGLFEAFDHAGFSWADAGDLDVARNFSLDLLPLPERRDARLSEVIRLAQALAAFAQAARARGETPLVLGGDHSASIGAIAGVASECERLGLLWIDAHPDANTPETSPSGNIHGMPLAVSLGRGLPELVNCHGFAPKVRPEDVCVVGAKDYDPGEMALLRELGVAVFTTFDIEHQGIARVMDKALSTVTRRSDAVYVSFDADVMDHALAPGTGISTRGGLSYREISFIMQFVGASVDVAGFDIIEVNPLLDIRNQTAELCVELAMSLLGVKYSDYERSYLKANRPGDA